MEILWKISYFSLCPEHVLIQEDLLTVQKHLWKCPVAHTDYQDFTKHPILLVISLNFPSLGEIILQKQCPLNLQDATKSFKFMNCFWDI